MDLLTAITFSPLLFVPILLLLPENRKNWIRWTAAAGTLVPLLLSVYLYGAFDRSLAGINDAASFQFVVMKPWIESFHIQYYMGIDGLSVTMILLTTLLSFLCIFASYGIASGLRGYFSMFLLLEVGMLGTFCALDFFLFYLFWELMLLPMYFLIGIWGGPRKVYAAIKFFLYTLFGSVLMLLCILALYFKGGHTFDMVRLMSAGVETGSIGFLGAALDFGKVIFLGLFIGFAIKVPIFPFHTWLPDAHVEAPTPVSVILAGVLLKMGTYGMMRISFPILPEATRWFAPALAVLALINIVYGALCAMAQKDLKKLIAYSSVSHMGFVLLGMASGTALGMNGAVLQMFNHGTITAMLFLLVGVIYDRAHHRQIEGFGGLVSRMPIYGAFTSLAFFAAIGLPGLSGFISEALVLLGGFRAFPLVTILSASGIVLGAAYMLWTYQRIFLGPLNERYADLPEISGREIFTLAPLGVIVIVLGFYPHPILGMMEASMGRLVQAVWG
ncbi:MAG: NADH-quinone oxidoreductase subunit M [Candidatus Latescibacterota bacterium]|nr:MAG: NADH-quinone oxidoreductase subunit M [Candidatus Latescibacterota bacterium]